MSDKVIGPSLPPNWKSIDKEKKNKSEDEEQCVYGPTLPIASGPIGPSLPRVCASVEENASTSQIIGPYIPSGFGQRRTTANDSDSDSDDMIGPIPETHHNFEKINDKFGNVSEILAQKEAQKQVKREREEWMTEAPKKLVSKIPTKSVKHFSQRSVKSDKISDKKYKKDEKREEELNQLMDSYNKNQKRNVSLIDIHNEKKKKKAKSEPKVEERAPFDREKDLNVRRMDARQTKSVLNKAKTFNDRFSLGINKFL